MSISLPRLNQISIGILNNINAGYSGLGIASGAVGRVSASVAPLQSRISLDDPANNPPSVTTQASSRPSLDQSLTDLRAELAKSIPQTVLAERHASVARYADQDVTEQQAVTRTQDVFEDRDHIETRTRYEDRDVFDTRNVYASRDLFETQNLYSTRDVFETQNVYATRDVFETRDVYETRNIYETRAVYRQEDIRETHVDGTRNLSSYSSTATAGIDIGADLSVAVGNDAASVIKFKSATQITVKTNGVTTAFNFQANDGSFRSALTKALSSVAGLSASFGSDGKLKLTTANAASLSIADVANALLDFSGSPLAALGLTAGTRQSTVVGTRQVQTGTEQVVVGTEQVKTGTQQVKSGTEQYVSGSQQVKTGTEQYVSGTQQVKIGTEQYVVGTEQVKIGTEQVAVGTEQVKTGVDRVKVGTEQVADGTRSVKVGTRRIEDGRQDVLIGLDRNTVISFTAQQSDRIRKLATQAIDSLGSFKFAALGAADASAQDRDAVKRLKALTVQSLTDVSSSAALVKTLSVIDEARTAAQRLSETVASKPRATTLSIQSLLPIAALGTPTPGADVASLLIQGSNGYASVIKPTGSRPAYAYGPPRVQSLT